MEFELADKAARLDWWEGGVEGNGSTGVEVVQHHLDLLGVREMDVDQFAHQVGEIQQGAFAR